MISWMQKHKKYLVITIWISTIAFVGAGFVGWGAYKYGNQADVMAEVGNIKITIKDFQNRYMQIYSSYNQLYGNKLDQNKAKEIGLDKMAFNELINEALLENYAKEIGLIVKDEEVAQKIKSMKVFWRDGKFNKSTYIDILKQNHLRPRDFENSIKKELLLQKIHMAIAPQEYPLEFNTIASALFIGDKLEYKILDGNDLNISLNEKELKQYFLEHRDNYKTPTKYNISYIEVFPQNSEYNKQELHEFYLKNRLNYLDKDGKILPFEKAIKQVKKDLSLKKAKKVALKKYIAFKKGKIKAEKNITITANDTQFPLSLLKKLQTLPSSKVLKPVLLEDRYIIVKLNKKILPKLMTFDEAKKIVRKDFELEKKAQELIKIAKQQSKNFKGIVTPKYICRDDIDQIKGLSNIEAAKFLKELFIKKDAYGYILISDQKIVLYKILDQKLQMNQKINKNRKLITDNTLKLKETLENKDILKKLQSLYDIKIYKGL